MGEKAEKIQAKLDVANRNIRELSNENAALRAAKKALLRAAGVHMPPAVRDRTDDPYEPPRTCPTCGEGELEGHTTDGGEVSWSCGHYETISDDDAGPRDVGGAGAPRSLQVVTDASGNAISTVMSAQDRDTTQRIAATLGMPMLDSDSDTLAAVAATLDRLHRGRVDPAFVKDTFAESIESNRRERSQLLDDLTACRAQISRLAAALQVGDWNKQTGDELVERAQRYLGLTHWLRKRAKEFGAEVGGEYARGAIDEINTILTMLVAPAELAKWLTKQPASRPVSDKLVELAQGATAAAGDFAQLQIINQVVGWVGSINDASPVAKLFYGLQAAPAVAREFSEYINAVIWPLLIKHVPAVMK